MATVRATLGGSKGCPAGISEKVEELDGFLAGLGGSLDGFANPVPEITGFRKDSEVPEIGGR